MFNPETAFELLKARMDRAGDSLPTRLEIYWWQRIVSAVEELESKGIHLEDTIADSMLVADLAAERILGRDKPGGLPVWLTLQIRQRWLKERGHEN